MKYCIREKNGGPQCEIRCDFCDWWIVQEQQREELRKNPPSKKHIGEK